MKRKTLIWICQSSGIQTTAQDSLL